jgi:hypothetical protein
MVKTCRKCHGELPVDAFPLDARNRDGRNTMCRSCQNEYLTVYRARRKAAALAEAEDAKPVTPAMLARRDYRVAAKLRRLLEQDAYWCCSGDEHDRACPVRRITG